MLLVFVFTLLQEHQDKFEVQSHEAKCKAVMHCDTVEIVTLERIYCYLYSLARDLFIPTVIDCDIGTDLLLFDKLCLFCFV